MSATDTVRTARDLLLERLTDPHRAQELRGRESELASGSAQCEADTRACSDSDVPGLRGR